MIVNSLVQVSSEPAKIMAAINKNSLTCEYILESKVFAAMPLAQNTALPFIGIFGFRTGRTFDKFANVKYKKGVLGAPIVLEHTTACYEAEVEKIIDVGTHYIIVGLVKETENFTQDKCLTYDYYHNVIKGKTPKGATHE